MSAALLLVAVLLLSGCVDLTARMELNGDGSGTLQLKYRLSSELWEMGVFDQGSSYVPVPLHEEDFRRVVAGMDGLELSSYRIERNETEVRIRSRIAFESIDALNRYYSPGEQRIRLEGSDAGHRFTIDLHPGVDAALDEQTRSFAETYLSDYHIRIEVQTPETIRDLGDFSAAEGGREASVSVPLSRLFTGDARRSVALEW
jgi:hypothetical protein